VVVVRSKKRVEADLEDLWGHVLMRNTGAHRITKRDSQVLWKRSMGVSREGLSPHGTARRSGADKV